MTTEVGYRLLHNLDAHFLRPYQPGDRLADGYRGMITAGTPNTVRSWGPWAAEFIFARHNRDDRPDGQSAPSLSVGDVVVFGETAWSVDLTGWVPVAVDAADLLGQPWLEVAR